MMAKREEVARLERELASAKDRVYDLQSELDELKRSILRGCDHAWEPDMTQMLSPYDRRNYKCEKCGSVHIVPGR